MLKCPNCGQKAEITNQWCCRWCGYPLVSRAFLREKKRRDALEARRIKKEEARARKERSAIVMPELKQETEEIIKRIAQQAEKEKHNSKLIPPQPKPSELPSCPSGVSKKIQTTDKIRVFIVDRDLLSSQGLVTCLSQNHLIEVIGQSDYFTEDTILTIQELAANIAFVDIDLPSLIGLDLARRIFERSPHISVIVLTPYEDNEQILGALKSGAKAYLSKHTPAKELAIAIQRVHKGERIIDDLLIRPNIARRVLNQFHDATKTTEDSTTSLSPQEAEILSHFADGFSRQQVAHAIAISDESIGNTLADIVSKLIAGERQRRTSGAS